MSMVGIGRLVEKLHVDEADLLGPRDISHVSPGQNHVLHPRAGSQRVDPEFRPGPPARTSASSQTTVAR